MSQASGTQDPPTHTPVSHRLVTAVLKAPTPLGSLARAREGVDKRSCGLGIRVQHLGMRIAALHPASCILHPTSCILHPASSILPYRPAIAPQLQTLICCFLLHAQLEQSHSLCLASLCLRLQARSPHLFSWRIRCMFSWCVRCMSGGEIPRLCQVGLTVPNSERSHDY